MISSSEPVRRVTTLPVMLQMSAQIQTDTLGQVMNVVFSQTCIRAGGTYLSAGVALLNAPDQGIVRISSNVGMGCDHLMGLHVGVL
jgi:hypothetical protein